MKIKWKLGIAAGLPLVFFAVQAGASVMGDIRDRGVVARMHDNVHMAGQAARVIDAVQRERGLSVLCSAGGCERSAVTKARAETDARLDPFVAALASSHVKAELKQDDWLAPRLAACRDSFASGATGAEIAPKYTALIHELMKRETGAAKAKTAKGFGKRVVSILLLEESKESCGLLRAKLSAAVAKPAAISADSKLAVASLFRESTSKLKSSVLVLGDQAKTKLDALLADPLLDRIEGIVRQVVDDPGSLTVEGREAFDLCSQLVDKMGAVTTTRTRGNERWNGAGLGQLGASALVQPHPAVRRRRRDDLRLLEARQRDRRAALERHLGARGHCARGRLRAPT